MGPSTGWKIALILSTAFYTACTGKSPAAPTAPPTAGPPPIAAAAIFLTPHTWDLPAGGGSLELVIATSANTVGNVPAPNVALSLTASSGTLSDTAPRTDSSGHARVTWTGTSSATITARAGEVVGTASIRVPASAPGPTPAPSPSPGPSPAPPAPTPHALKVDIFPTPRGTDAATPVSFLPVVTTLDGSPVGTLTYAWDFNEDGETDSTIMAPTFLFLPRDHWTVRLAVASADGRTGTGQIDIVVGAAPAPAVSVTLTTSPATAVTGAPFTFTSSATGNSTAGPVVAYDWDFGDGAPTLDRTTTTPSTSTSYPTPGTYTVRVTARTANASSGTASVGITVADKPLVVDITMSGTPTAGSTLTFTATVTSPTGGSVPSSMTFSWDYGNGTETVTGSSPRSVNHVYSVAGDYDVTVTVTASDGRTATKTLKIKVS